MTNKPLSQCCNSEMVKGHYCSKGNTLTKCKNYRCLKCGKPAIPREEKKTYPLLPFIVGLGGVIIASIIALRRFNVFGKNTDPETANTPSEAKRVADSIRIVDEEYE